jgi:hypothetical protein
VQSKAVHSAELFERKDSAHGKAVRKAGKLEHAVHCIELVLPWKLQERSVEPVRRADQCAGKNPTQS